MRVQVLRDRRLLVEGYVCLLGPNVSVTLSEPVIWKHLPHRGIAAGGIAACGMATQPDADTGCRHLPALIMMVTGRDMLGATPPLLAGLRGNTARCGTWHAR